MSDRELLELLLSRLNSMDKKFYSMDGRIDPIESHIKEIKIDLKSVNDQTGILQNSKQRLISDLICLKIALIQ